MAVRWERFLDLLTVWSAHLGQWVVLSGDRQTGKSTALRALADHEFAIQRPFVLWEYPEQVAGAPWHLLSRPNTLSLLDDWPSIHPSLRPPVHLTPGRGLIAVTDAGPWRQPLASLPENTWPFPPSAAVVWIQCQRGPDRRRITWRARGAAQARGTFRLTLRLSPALRVFEAHGSRVYAYPTTSAHQVELPEPFG